MTGAICPREPTTPDGAAQRDGPRSMARALVPCTPWPSPAAPRARANRVSNALIQLEPRYSQDAERRLLQNVYRSVIVDEVQHPSATQSDRRRGDWGSSPGRASAAIAGGP
jgi:hypothetical protein